MDNYEQELAKLKKRKDKADHVLRSTERAMNELFAEMFFERFKTSSDLKFGILDQATPGVPIELPTVKHGVIHTVKQPKESARQIRYLTDWSSGAMLPNHYHSDCEEEIIVSIGSCKIILETGEQFVLNEGEKLKVASGVKHQVTALERSNLIIDFFKVQEDFITSSLT